MLALHPEKLKPCPACGTNKLRVFAWDSETRYGECLRPGCRMSGPLGKTDTEAAAKCNALPRLAPNTELSGRPQADGPA